MSYDVITPSAARGILEAIYWKPEIEWVVDRLHVLRPIRFTSLRRNEVSEKIPAAAAAVAMREGRGALGLYVETVRQQRATLLLRDVEYIIEAHFASRGAELNDGKHLDMFNRRARKGQCFTRPYLGCREFAAHFALIDGDDAIPSPHFSLRGGPVDLGWMLHDIDFERGREPKFFHATMTDGVIQVPRLRTASAAS